MIIRIEDAYDNITIIINDKRFTMRNDDPKAAEKLADAIEHICSTAEITSVVEYEEVY